MAGIELDIFGALPDDTNPPQFAVTSAETGYWTFDDTTVEPIYWQFRMPDDYSSAPVLKVAYSMASATTGTLELRGYLWAMSDGDSADSDTASFDTANAGTDAVPGTAGFPGAVSITMTNADSVAAGDLVVLKLDRNTSAGSDPSGDAEIRAVTLTYTAA